MGLEDRRIPITNLLNLSVSFNRTSAFPIDARSFFSSLADAKAAASTAKEVGSDESVYYYGMPITVFSEGVASMYIIQGDGSLRLCGTSVLPDGKSLEFKTDGETLQMKNFGKEYYAFHDKDTIIEGEDWVYPTDMPVVSDEIEDGTYCHAHNGSIMSWCVLENRIWVLAPRDGHPTPWYELTEGWKAGLEPKVTSNEGGEFVIAWYEPSSTTIEGLSSIVEGLSGEVSALSERVASVEQKALTPDNSTIFKTNTNVIYVNEIETSKVKGLNDTLSWKDYM